MVNKMYVNIDYENLSVIGKHSCSKCGVNLNEKEGLMVSIIQSGNTATFYVCNDCLKGASLQSREFDITKNRYPILGLR